MAKLLLSDRILLEDNRIWKGGIFIDDRGYIDRLVNEDDVARGLMNKVFEGVEVYDFKKYVIMPGLIDTNVHINEPGRGDWEGFETATKAAAAGGYTTLCDMPLNSIPPTTTLGSYMAKLTAARDKLYVDVSFWGGIIPDNTHQLRNMIKYGVVGFNCFLCPTGVPEFPHVDQQQLEWALTEIRDLDVAIAFHAELASGQTIKEVTGDPHEYKTYLDTRPAEMEVEAVEMVAKIALRFKGIHAHIAHLSAAEALPVIREYRRKGANNLTVETCHHYLALNSEAVPRNRVDFKCCPPIRDKANQELLWQAVKDGDINMVVSDHSPCTPELKLLNPDRPNYGNFLMSWGGVASLQLGLSLFWTNCQKYGLTMHDMMRLMCTEPARLCQICNQKGYIEVGYMADLCIWEPDGEFTVEPDMIHFRHKQNPYMGQKLKGTVYATMVTGQFAYKRDRDNPFRRVGHMMDVTR